MKDITKNKFKVRECYEQALGQKFKNVSEMANISQKYILKK